VKVERTFVSEYVDHTPLICFITESPVVTADPSTKTEINANDNLRLFATVLGEPTPTLTWTRNNQSVIEGAKVKVTVSGNRVTLSVADAKSAQSGEYRLVAENKHGQAETKWTVIVKGIVCGWEYNQRLSIDRCPLAATTGNRRDRHR
jgi:hypothetical protein